MAENTKTPQEFNYYTGGYPNLFKNSKDYGFYGDKRVLATRIENVWGDGRIISVFDTDRIKDKKIGYEQYDCVNPQDIIWMIQVPKECLNKTISYRIIPNTSKNLVQESYYKDTGLININSYIPSKGLKISVVSKILYLNYFDCETFKVTKTSDIIITKEHNNLETGVYTFQQIKFDLLCKSNESVIHGFRVEKNSDENLRLLDSKLRIEFFFDGGEYVAPSHTQ